MNKNLQAATALLFGSNPPRSAQPGAAAVADAATSARIIREKHEVPSRATESIAERYRRVRRQSELLCEPLLNDDFNVQAMAEVSPPKWHLAHTSWFFETFVLKPFCPRYQPYHPQYEQLFNSYYNGVGTPFPRAQRGLLARPCVAEVFSYRAAIDQQIQALLGREHPQRDEVRRRVALGLQHEQQHQELLLTDIKYNFSCNPLAPVYLPPPLEPQRSVAEPLDWCEFAGGIAALGAAADDEFCFDNELPRHRVLLAPYALANRPVSNGEYLAFIEDGGYQQPQWWLADGWNTVQRERWFAPLYWRNPIAADRVRDGEWSVFTLHGELALDPAAPVCHLSYYEADAYARWVGARLPTEAEWECAAAKVVVDGRFVNDGVLQPRPACGEQQCLQQLYGDVWEWTASAYAPYPGFVALGGELGEYNGKFMCNQMVLRGGSCLSEREHLRASYRNFFYPWDRWQCAGLRLARSLPDATAGGQL